MLTIWKECIKPGNLIMTKKSILCIVEGEVSEVKILNKINQEFIGENIEFVPICTNIYHFYHAYLKYYDNDIGVHNETFLFLQEYDKSGVIKDKKRHDFLAIYLFMDLDKHEPLANDYLDCIPNMLTIFDNHSENGKLYISYPMVEAFQHPIIGKETSLIELGKKYKTHINQIKTKEFSGIKFIEKSELIKSFIGYLKQSNYLIDDNFSFPNVYNIEKWSQSNIYISQFNKYISPNQQVLVLSPFTLFLLEYLGEKLFGEWQSIAHEINP